METKNMLFSAESKALYRLAGAMALVIVLAGLVDALSSQGIEAGDNRAVDIRQWYALFQTRPFSALSRLGLINIITLSSALPVYLAFYQAYRRARVNVAAAGLAVCLFWVGTAVYLSSNSVFALFGLSQQYAAAPAAHRPILEAAGRALLAQGADLTPGTFLGLFFTQAAGLLITASMLRGAVFSRWTGWVGLAGFSLMMVFFMLTAFFPERYQAAMLISAPGGLLLMAYQVLLARRFFQLGRS